jgi:hypothetical protein
LHLDAGAFAQQCPKRGERKSHRGLRDHPDARGEEDGGETYADCGGGADAMGAAVVRA